MSVTARRSRARAARVVRRSAFAMVVGAAASLSLSAVAEAASCGGDKPCACGDKVTRDYTLTADLGPCPDNGLRVGGAVTLDGGGFTIRGPGPGVAAAGVRIGDDGNGAVVRNLTVTGFENGIRLVGARNVRLTDVVAHGNGDPGPREGYGIDVSSAASDNVLERVNVYGNADEGIHVGTDAARNRIVDAQVHDNGRENVYFLACRDNRLERSRVWGSGAGNAAVYVKFASGTVLEGNTISDGAVHVRGGSTGTELIDNTLRNAVVVLEDQNDKRFGRGSPSATTVRGGSIDTSDSCMRIAAGTGTRIDGVKLTCPDGIRVAKGVRVAVVGSGADEAAIRCAGGGSGCVQRLPTIR
jgi:nitrous oxidase accessory protein NosD